MKLLNLKAENFQGIDSLEIEADGNDLSIKGENGTGKTTVANAIAWLLFGKSSTGEKGYSPKTIDEDGNEVHYLHHSADGVFQLDDKSQLTLKKDYYESWQKFI
jgi:recombinational DNA repair ATPase RecF